MPKPTDPPGHCQLCGAATHSPGLLCDDCAAGIDACSGDTAPDDPPGLIARIAE